MLYVRLLGPVGTGQYYFVVAIYGFFEIISRYGLGTLLTRDVAADKNQSSRYLTNVVALRTLLWLISLPLMALVVLGYRLRWGKSPGSTPLDRRSGGAGAGDPWPWRCSLPTTPTRSAACSMPLRRWNIRPG